VRPPRALRREWTRNPRQRTRRTRGNAAPDLQRAG